jgi:Flp pilus assembly protein TadB
MVFGMILFWGLVGLVVYLLSRGVGSRRDQRSGSRSTNVLEVLDRRLAEALISPDEYRERRTLIVGTRNEGPGQEWFSPVRAQSRVSNFQELNGRRHKMKSWHMLICFALIAAGIALVATGAGAIALIPVIGCALMMGAMVWMMRSDDG